MTIGGQGGSVDGACTRMTPLLETLASVLGFCLGAVSLGAVIYGAGRKMQARQGVDDLEALTRGQLARDVGRHEGECSDDREAIREDLDKVILEVRDMKTAEAAAAAERAKIKANK